MKKGKRNYKKAGLVSALTLIAIGFTVGLLTLFQTGQPIVEQVYQRQHRNIPLGDPAGDESGFCAFYHYPHSADPGTDYATNLSTATAYEYITSLSGEMTGETPYSTLHDYVIKIVVNDSVGYNTSSSSWEPSWLFMNMTMDYSFGSDIAWSQMTLVEIANTTNFCWYNGYLNNAGAGYTLSHNQKTNASFNLTGWF